MLRAGLEMAPFSASILKISLLLDSLDKNKTHSREDAC